uniref:DNA-directed RNA polymerase RBP11-like dimerisation domain-containing protein n=1 Tax=Nelumbo nucifera TaxID=4432 RepID=A0A822ZH77_NELNU|nr:TPA_asm: hypothetical protein HUJ06_000616 [Nelumbo nucifera]
MFSDANTCFDGSVIVCGYVDLVYLYSLYNLIASLLDGLFWLYRQLHRDPNVLFAGYKLPHPLQYKIIVRIHTTSQSSPMQAYNQAINDLDRELNHLKNAFEV